MASKHKDLANRVSYESISHGDLPFGRKGKHHQIIADILSDLQVLNGNRALKIPLDGLSDSKANIRSALHRASRIRGIEIATSSDDDFLYVWKGSHKE